MGLAPGMTLVVEKEETGGVRLQVQPESPVLVDEGGVLVVKSELSDDLTELVRRERDARVFALLQREGL